MKNIDCGILELLKADFNSLWRCKCYLGNTVEVVTPYLMPDSTFLTLYFTQQGDRLIACEGGRILELLSETLPNAKDEALAGLRVLAKENNISEGENDGEPVFFKECKAKKLLSSIAFDLGNFATMSANVLITRHAMRRLYRGTARRFSTT